MVVGASAFPAASFFAFFSSFQKGDKSVRPATARRPAAPTPTAVKLSSAAFAATFLFSAREVNFALAVAAAFLSNAFFFALYARCFFFPAAAETSVPLHSAADAA